jgi:hypothetical protein
MSTLSTKNSQQDPDERMSDYHINVFHSEEDRG